MKKHIWAAAPLVLMALVLACSLSTPAYADDEPLPWLILDDEGDDAGDAWEDEEILSSGIALVTSDHLVYMTAADGYFNPSDNLTRSQAAQIVFRLLNRQVPITKTFSDIPEDAWYADAANTLGSLGLARLGEDTFQPDDVITRAEFVRYVASFSPIRRDAEQFSDVPDGHPDARYLLSARAWGWLGGFSDGAVHPDAPITRAEAAALLNRALGRVPDREYIDASRPIFYWDVSPGSWFYYDVAEASVAHEHAGSAAAERWTSCTPVLSELSRLSGGFNLVDGWLYYFDSAKNDVVRSASVGNFDFNELGRFTSGNAQLDELLHNICLENTNESMTQEEKLRALYLYTRDSFAYLRRAPYPFGVLDFMEEDALRILTTGYGNCYCYASVFWYLSRWIGYDARIVNGTVGQRRSPHSWVEITFNGVSYIFDTELEMAYRQRGQYINMYKWTGSGWNYIR